MKRIYVVLLTIGLLFSLDGLTLAKNNPEKKHSYSVYVEMDGFPVPNAYIMGIGDNESITKRCNAKGFAELKSFKPVDRIIAVIFGASGFSEAHEDDLITISLNPIESTGKKIVFSATSQSETFHYPYHVDNNGDAYYRYPINAEFSHFWLYGNLPGWLWIETDPNDWKHWPLTDYLPEYNGRRILIPRRATWYYMRTYKRPITNDLYLVTNP